MISRIDQQLLVNRRMIDYLTGLDKKTVSGKVRSYMTSYLEIIMTVSSIMLIRAETEEALQKKKELWSYLRRKDIFLYYRLRYGIIGGTTNLPGKGGRKISVEGYKICRRIFKFN